RAIRLVDYRPHAAELPLLGKVAAGSPIAAVEAHDKLDLNELFGGKDHFALQVRGQSMIDDHIDDGDYVVSRRQESAEPGPRVGAMIDNEVTLKRLSRDSGKVWLEPANAAMAPIPLDPLSDNRILGVLVGVLRKCR